MSSHVMEDAYPTISEEAAEKETDDRIPITNSTSLDKILQIAVNNISKVAELLPPTERSQLVSRFTETFREIMHQNVSLEGLPWATSDDLISSSLAEAQAEETEDALRSKLATEVEGLARQRMGSTAECSRLFEIKLKHERQNVKILAVDHPLPPPQACPPPTPAAFPHQELVGILSDLTHTQTKIHTLSEELPRLQANFQVAKDIVMRQQQQLEDTGYMSA